MSIKQNIQYISKEIDKLADIGNAISTFIYIAAKDFDNEHPIEALLKPHIDGLWDIIGGYTKTALSALDQISNKISENNNKIFDELDNAGLLLSSIKTFCNMHDATTAISIEMKSLAGAHMLIQSQVENIERSLEKISVYQKNIDGILRPKSDGDVIFS